MSWHTDQLKFAFGIGGLMSFYGIVGFIVIMLPANAMGSNTKIVTIVLILLTLPFMLLGAYLVSRRGKKKAKKEAEAQAAAQAAQAGGASHPRPRTARTGEPVERVEQAP